MQTPTLAPTFDLDKFCARAAQVLSRVRDEQISLEQANHLLAGEVPHSEPVLHRVAGWVSIITPYLDRSNDYIQVYLLPIAGEWIVLGDDWTTGRRVRESRSQNLGASLRQVITALIDSGPATSEPPSPESCP